MAKASKKKRVRGGSSKAALAAKRVAFVHEYMNNGQNITQAAITIGMSERSAGQLGHRLYKQDETQALIKQEMDARNAASGLSVERTLRELARVAYSDPRKFFDKSGHLIPVHLLDDETAPALASLEIEERFTRVGKAKKRTLAGFVRRVKLWDKNSALEKAMKYHKLYTDAVIPPGGGGTTIIIQASQIDEDL